MSQRQPAEREPAPSGLARVQDFINTRDIEGGRERWPHPHALGDWLKTNGLLPEEASDLSGHDLARAMALRETLRDACVTNHDEGPLPPQTAALLEEATARAAYRIVFDDSGDRLQPTADGIDAALGLIASDVFTARADGTWHRLKACDNHRCRWVFYDHSRSQTGRWCSMEICGNRAKAADYYRRRRGVDGR